jgi:hypothetical protein
LDIDHYDSEQKTKEDTESDQCDRSDLLHSDLDPHKGGAPDRAQQKKDKPVFEFQGILLDLQLLFPALVAHGIAADGVSEMER